MARLFTQGNTKAGKLTTQVVVEIRRLYHQEGWTQGQLARHFNVTVGTIGRIVRGETWQQQQMPVSTRAAYQAAELPLTPDRLAQAAHESHERMLRQLEAQAQTQTNASPPDPAPGLCPASTHFDDPAEQSSPGLSRLEAEAGKFREAEQRVEEQLKKLLGEEV